MAVPGHQRAEAKVVVDILVSVNVADLAALPFLYKNRIRVIRAVIAGDPQRNALQRTGVCLRRFRRTLLVNHDFFLKCFMHGSLRYSRRSLPCSQYVSGRMSPVVLWTRQGAAFCGP